MQAHVPTMFLMIITVSLAMTACTAALWRPGRGEGLGYWTLALGFHTVVYLLFAQRGAISDYLSIVLANTLLALVLALFAEGVMEFRRRRPNRWLTWSPVLAVLVCAILLLDDIVVRIPVLAGITSYQCLLLLFYVHGSYADVRGRGQYFLSLSFALLAGILAFRGVATAFGTEKTLDITSSNAVQTVTFLASVAALIWIVMGLVLMTKERSDEQLKRLAMYDELTGLPNRRSILETLDRLLAAGRRQKQPVSVLMLDIDHFKQINDEYGHPGGDATLKRLAETFRQRLRTQDHVGRLGGEEFLLVLPNTDEKGARELAEQLRQNIEQSETIGIGGQTIRITASIGFCCVKPDSGMATQQAVSAADHALYSAKREGRNRVVSSTFVKGCGMPALKRMPRRYDERLWAGVAQASGEETAECWRAA